MVKNFYSTRYYPISNNELNDLKHHAFKLLMNMFISLLLLIVIFILIYYIGHPAAFLIFLFLIVNIAFVIFTINHYIYYKKTIENIKDSTVFREKLDNNYIDNLYVGRREG